jgi:hypothetical protein
MGLVFGDAVGVPLVAAPDFKGFMGQRYRENYVRGEQTYFCISTVKDIPRTAFLSRKAEDLVRTMCIVLDDCGTKVKLPIVKPTWVMETSPGNFQYGYKLSGGAEPAEAAALVEALIAAGHTDPGAGRADRVMRLPGSLNAKPQHNGWRARVTVWNPEVSYTLGSLALAFQVTPGHIRPVAAPERVQDTPDPVFDWMLGRGGIIKDGPNPRGWYSMTCPWEHEHQTPPYDHGTDYKPGDSGVFKCMHASCKDRHTASLRAWIAEQDPDADIGVISHELVADLGAKLRALMGQQGTLRERLQLLVRAAPLGPWKLPDPGLTAAGNVSQKQTVTEVRVEKVMGLIGAKARHNAMNGSVEITMKDYHSDEDASDAGMATIIHACDRCGMTNANSIRNAVLNIAICNKFNPAEDWVQALPWDGTDRLKTLCDTITLRNLKFEPWKAVAIRRWCLQVVAAIVNHRFGEQAHPIGYVLVLQGEQGLNKSFWIKSLMPPNMVTLGLSLKLDKSEKDSVSRATATPIGELAELDASFKHSDTSALKNFLTTPVDAYRPAYGYRTIRTPRSTAFAGTINPTTFLHDASGERRFWPLGIKACNASHGIDMQQFWAQMWHYRIHQQEQYWLTAEEEKLHEEAISDHEVENEVGSIVEDLILRRHAMKPGEKYVVMNMKELLARYGVRFMKVHSADLHTALTKAKFEQGAHNGHRGFRVPNTNTVLTEAQLAGLKVIK